MNMLLFVVWMCWCVLSSAIASAKTPPVPVTISQADMGKPMPAFQLKTLQGETIDSQTLDGRVIILNFWATWCGPCKDEMPSLERLRQQFPSTKLQILAVTKEHRPRDIQAFWEQLGLTFEVLLDEHEELSQTLMIRNLPTTVIVDPHGYQAGRVMGPREWDSPETVTFLKGLLAQE